MKLIDKDAVVDKIEKLKKNQSLNDRHSQGVLDGLHAIEKFINSIEVKEVELEKEYKDYINCDNGHTIFEIAKHFFELGVKTTHPITANDRGIAEEIIINLKRVEKDYRIDLTKEIEWLRNQTKKR